MIRGLVALGGGARLVFSVPYVVVLIWIASLIAGLLASLPAVPTWSETTGSVWSIPPARQIPISWSWLAFREADSILRGARPVPALLFAVFWTFLLGGLLDRFDALLTERPASPLASRAAASFPRMAVLSLAGLAATALLAMAHAVADAWLVTRTAPWESDIAVAASRACLAAAAVIAILTLWIWVGYARIASAVADLGLRDALVRGGLFVWRHPVAVGSLALAGGGLELLIMLAAAPLVEQTLQPGGSGAAAVLALQLAAFVRVGARLAWIAGGVWLWRRTEGLAAHIK